jgi:RNA polymerase sigma factor (sigma-70 family)
MSTSVRGPIEMSNVLENLPSVVLLSRLKEGNHAARDEIIRRYWPRLERWARGRLPPGARDLYETGDLVQETMLAALKRLEEFEPRHDGALPAYFRAAILNRIRTLAVRAKTRGERVDLGSALVDAGPSPLEEAVGREAVDRYELALSRLRPDDREAIQLRVELGLPYQEIAREMEKPTVTAARMAVSRALCRLAIEMGRRA